MENPKVLYVSQEIKPYLPDSPIACLTRELPQAIIEAGCDVRTFMPRFGNVNERRNMLHEVIRLSGLNIIIDDTDHPLIIKVASIPAARMQIYFIDNDDFFARKATITDPETNAFFDDNDERAIFFARGVLETTRKLRWTPDIIHLHGWFTMMIPVYMKTLMKNDPTFKDCKIVVSLYDDAAEVTPDGESVFKWKNIKKKLWMQGVSERSLRRFKISDYHSLLKTAIDEADGITICSQNPQQSLVDYANELGKPVLPYSGPLPDATAAYLDFYRKITE